MYGTPPALNRKTADDRSGRDCAGQVSAVFPDVCRFLLKLESLRRTIEDHSFETFTLEERKRWNQELYVDILGENYKKSFADPTYAVKMLSEVYGQLLSFCIQNCAAGFCMHFEQIGLSDDLK